MRWQTLSTFLIGAIYLTVFPAEILADDNFLKEFFNPGISATPRFSGNQLYDITEKINLEKIDGSVECFGDFNSDKYTDIFVMNRDRNKVQVWLWAVKTFTYEPLTSATIERPNIGNIAAGDFDYDGKMDLLITGGNDTSSFMEIWSGDYVSFRGNRPIPIPDHEILRGDVLVLDVNGDMKLDLFGAFESGDRLYWINKGEAEFTLQPVRSSDAGQLSLPNGNAVVDMNGNCLADLVITSTIGNDSRLEIWNWASNTFQHEKNIALSRGSRIPSYGDVDGDGTMDIVVPVCFPEPNCNETNSIEILFNVQVPMCTGVFAGSGACRSAQDLCTADAQYAIENGNSSAGSASRVVVPESAFSGGRFFWDEDHAITLRMGDYNLDGFPDLIFPIVQQAGTVVASLWVSVPCQVETCGEAATNAMRRTYAQVTEGVDELTAVKDPYAATFVDFDENGILDILVLTNSQENSTKRIYAVYNNFFNDAFFLKTMGLNGVWSEFQKPKPYGVNFPGATWKYTISELNGDKKVFTGVQLRQSGNLALQTPYILFGLGRTSNYIEEIYMGIAPSFHMWIQAIPKAQVVGIPSPADDPSSWKLELYIRTLGLALWAAVAVASWLVVTGAMIYFFRWREKRQDQALKQEKAHLVNFDAL